MTLRDESQAYTLTAQGEMGGDNEELSELNCD